jgi:hypothetical protein
MEARTSLWTLHPAVACEKVAAHAQGKAVGLIRTDELGLVDLQNGHRGRNPILAVESALDFVQIPDSTMVAMIGHGVNLLQPLHLTVTQEWIATQ